VLFRAIPALVVDRCSPDASRPARLARPLRTELSKCLDRTRLRGYLEPLDDMLT